MFTKLISIHSLVKQWLIWGKKRWLNDKIKLTVIKEANKDNCAGKLIKAAVIIPYCRKTTASLLVIVLNLALQLINVDIQYDSKYNPSQVETQTLPPESLMLLA